MRVGRSDEVVVEEGGESTVASKRLIQKDAVDSVSVPSKCGANEMLAPATRSLMSLRHSRGASTN